MFAQAQKLPLADPFILYYNNLYYAYGTTDPDGIAVYTSADLTYWTKAQNLALHKNNSYADRWFWAPEVYYLNGQFYMYYSADEHICVATGSSPLGPFVQDVQQPMLPDKAIDNSLFIDDDGTPYLFFVRFTDGNAVWMAELEDDYKTIKTSTMRLCFAANTSGWEADLGKVTEGPFCIKYNGWYYLTYSANDYRSQNYGVGYAFAFNINAAWTKFGDNPIFQKPNNTLFGTGHHCFFRDRNDNLKMAFHAHKSATEVNPREMYITDVNFTNPPRGKSDLNISPNYQATFAGTAAAVNRPQNAAKARILLEGKQLSIKGGEIKAVNIYSTSGVCIAQKSNEPFSFLVKNFGCYFAVIKYKNDETEVKRVII
jgi:beta-xylosidase